MTGKLTIPDIRCNGNRSCRRVELNEQFIVLKMVYNSYVQANLLTEPKIMSLP